MKRLRCLAIALSLLAGLALPFVPAWAQGDGPRTNFLMPVGLGSFSVTYVTVDSNFRFGQSAILDDAKLETRVLAASYAYRFSWRDRFAQISIAANLVTLDGQATTQQRTALPSSQTLYLTRTGWGDPGLSLRVGLLGTPALSPKEWRETEPGAQLYAQLGVNLPLGDYDPRLRFNTGTNRGVVSLKLPAVIPLKTARRTTFIEITPSVNVFGDNDAPFGDTQRLEQEPLYSLEGYVVHNFTPRLWVAGGIQYQYGGRTIADGVADDNRLKQWLGEASFGYILSPTIALLGSWGKILELENRTRGQMVRLRLAWLL